MDTKQNNAIILIGAGILIAILVVFALLGARSERPEAPGATGFDLDAVPVVSSADNTRGAENASVKLIEYSDIECPFCQEYHDELLDVVEREPLANFSWTYRHFPLTQIHQNAFRYAIATECAAEQDGFWNYLDTMVNRVRNDEQFSNEGLVELATALQLDGEVFNSCLNESAVAAEIEAEAEQAQAAGATGTPFSVFEFDREVTDNELEGIQGLFGNSTRIVLSDDNTKLAIGGSLGATQIREIVNLFVDPATDNVIENVSEGTEE